MLKCVYLYQTKYPTKTRQNDKYLVMKSNGNTIKVKSKIVPRIQAPLQ